MNVPSAERGFALAVLLACALFVLAAGTGGARQASTAVDVETPGEYDFEMPDADGVATVDGEHYDSLQAALDAAEAGSTVHVRGRFEGPVVIETPNVTLAGAGPNSTLVDGDAEGDVLTIDAPNVTVDGVWVRNGGYDTADNDAGVWVDAPNVTIRDSRVTEMTFGIWLDSVTDARVVNTTIVGREEVRPLTERGNGIQIYETTDSLIANNRITDVRDGIYYSWASEVLARNNTMWDLRYGVHYMYSDDCRLVGNTAVGNDVGYALMVSEHLVIRNNVAVNNSGNSGHGILVKSIDHTTIANNTLVGNKNGLFIYNSLDNEIVGNLVKYNEVGAHLTAGSVDERVHHNAFVANDQPVKAVIGEQVAWNTSTAGNYWSGATRADVDNDGISEVRYQPAGTVERLTATSPATRIYASSPAFDAIRRAESTVPLVKSPGVVDYHPLTAPPTNWSESR